MLSFITGFVHFVCFGFLRPINNLSVIQGRVLLGWTTTKLGLMCLAQGHSTVTPVRLEPAAPRSRMKHSTTELYMFYIVFFFNVKDSDSIL